MTREEVVILGAGITGLSIAHELRRSRPNLKLDIVARDLPIDEPYSQAFGSVWAGADWSATGEEGSREAKWEQQTYEEWVTMTENSKVPSEVMALVDVEKHVEKDEDGLWSRPWWRHVGRDFRVQDDAPGNQAILHYKSFCLDAPAYLSHLFKTLVDPKTLCSSDGLAKIHRDEVKSLHSIRERYPNAKVLINASGLGAQKLAVEDGGLGDTSCHFIRGQTLSVQIPPNIEPKIFTGVNSFSSTVAKKGGQDQAHELSYIIPRARSGMVILGGSYEPDRMYMQEDTKQTTRILRESARLWPALIPPPSSAHEKDAGSNNSNEWERIKVAKVNVGFRPGRSAGIRVELVVEAEQGCPVLHAYGLGGAGYQRSVGVALAVNQELDKVLLTTRRLVN